jgi:phosphopantetheine--protein transferase-like protein
MIGIDMLEIDRIKTVANEAFLTKVFSASERQYIAGKNNAAETIAGLFCAKEAVLKALGSGIGDGCGFSQIEISHTASGQPAVTLRGKAAEVLTTMGSSIFVSISHNKTTAVAVAVVK